MAASPLRILCAECLTDKDPRQMLIFPTLPWLWNSGMEWLTVPHEIVSAGAGMSIWESRSVGVRVSISQQDQGSKLWQRGS